MVSQTTQAKLGIGSDAGAGAREGPENGTVTHADVAGAVDGLKEACGLAAGTPPRLRFRRQG